MTENDIFDKGVQFIALAHKYGFAVVICTPSEVKGINVDQLENYMIEAGNDFVMYKERLLDQ